jgi:hypothetical protein
MPKDDKQKPAEEAESNVPKPAAEPAASKAPKKLSRAELEGLRRELQRKFH